MKKDTQTNFGLQREEIDGSTHLKKGEGEKINDDFDRTALEGWKMSGKKTSSMENLDRKFRFPTRFSYKFLNLMSALFLIAAILTAITIHLTSTKQTEKPTRKLSVLVDRTEFNLPESIDTLRLLNNKERIQAKRIISDQKQLEQIREQQKSIEPEGQFNLPDVFLEPLPVLIETKEATISYQKNAKEIILNDLKAIDYSIYRTKPTVEIQQVLLTGTPADLEKGDGISNESEIKQVQIPYMDYLSKTLLYINKGKWKQALQRLQEITNQYPNDVNARFYSGLCYFNLQQYSEASIQFSTCLQLEFSNFNEESTWYLAHSKFSKGEKKEAKELFELIRNQKGFYAKQAEKVLKNW